MDILDIHCHLGNILQPGGDALIGQSAPFRYGFDPDALFRAMNYHGQSMGDLLYRAPFMTAALARAERRRNEAATLENLIAARKRQGITRCCVLPIAPYVTFEGVCAAAQADEGIIPFGSVDFTRGDIAEQVHAQHAAGAKGFKLHPILQRVHPLGDEVEAFFTACPPGVPVMVHTGISSYYPREECARERPEYGAAALFLEMASRYRHTPIIAAHGALQEHAELVRGMGALEHVFVDTSFAQASRLRALFRVVGGKRLLFGSDWPYGFPSTSMRCLRETFGKTPALMEDILWGNGARLLKL